jgi:threonine/homoserine/homoserine lactone efflux protein
LLSFGQTAGFLLAAILLTLAPGPDILMVLGLGLARGRRQGMAFGLGCAMGCLSHTVLAAAGVSAMIAASPALFRVLKVMGGLYLLWLGVKALQRGKERSDVPDEGLAGQAGSLFRRGLLANAVNPKVVLFFLAFLPQFVVSERGPVWLQLLEFGVLFTVQAAILFSLIGWFSGSVGRWFRRTPKAGVWLDRVSAGVFLVFGARLLFAP